MSTKVKNFRKSYIINPKFQYSFIGYVCIATVVSMLSYYLSNLYFFYRMKGLGQSINLPEGHIYFKFISEQMVISNIVFAINSLFVFAGIIISGVLLSNKVAGPIYRICKEANEIKTHGKMKKISIRSGDYFPELKDAFNDIIEMKESP